MVLHCTAAAVATTGATLGSHWGITSLMCIHKIVTWLSLFHRNSAVKDPAPTLNSQLKLLLLQFLSLIWIICSCAFRACLLLPGFHL